MTVTAASRSERECSAPEAHQSDSRAVVRRNIQLPVPPSPDVWNPVRFAPETD